MIEGDIMLPMFMSIKEGAYYLTECGDIVGPAKLDPDPIGKRCWKIGGCSYYGNGTAFGYSDKWALELVKEIPHDIAIAVVSRRDHERITNTLRARVDLLEKTLSCLKDLPLAIDALRSLGVHK